jgi:hypothetical protein
MISYTRPRYTRGLYGYKDLDLCKTHLQGPSRAFTYIENEPCSERESIMNCSAFRAGYPWFWFRGIQMRVSDFK